MLLILFLILVAVPAIEIALFVQVGGQIGIWPTLFLTFGTAAAGTLMLRIQGLATLARAQAALERDQAPVAELIDGVCLLLAGLLLLIPGFFTDALGLLMFIPPLRREIGLFLWRRAKIRRDRDAGVVDGEYDEVRKPDRALPPADKSKWGRR